MSRPEFRKRATWLGQLLKNETRFWWTGSVQTPVDRERPNSNE